MQFSGWLLYCSWYDVGARTCQDVPDIVESGMWTVHMEDRNVCDVNWSGKLHGAGKQDKSGKTAGIRLFRWFFF